MCQVIDDDTRWRNRFIFEVMCVADATEAVNYIKVQNSNYYSLGWQVVEVIRKKVIYFSHRLYMQIQVEQVHRQFHSYVLNYFGILYGIH